MADNTSVGATHAEWTKPTGGNWFDPSNSQFRAGSVYDALKKSQSWKQGQGSSGSGYQGGWAQPFSQGSGANVSPMGSGKWMHQYQPAQIAGIVHHPQQQQQSSGGGFGSLIGQGLGFVAGNMIAPGVGGAAGAQVGGAIGSQFG